MGGEAECVGAEGVAEMWQVNSHARVTACCRLAASMWLPCQFGCILSALKREGRFQKKM